MERLDLLGSKASRPITAQEIKIFRKFIGKKESSKSVGLTIDRVFLNILHRVAVAKHHVAPIEANPSF